MPGEIFEQRDDLSAGETTLWYIAQCLVQELSGDFLEHHAQGRLGEHAVGGRLVPGGGMGVEAGELEIEHQVILGNVAGEGRRGSLGDLTRGRISAAWLGLCSLG